MNFTNQHAHTATLQRILDRHRGNKKRRKERFREELEEILEGCDVHTTVAPGLATWIDANPRRCAGWRLYFEVLQAWIRNTTDVAKDGDVNDLTHLFAVPYVDFATLDGRFVSYCGQATRELRKSDRTIDYDKRVLPSFRAIMSAVP